MPQPHSIQQNPDVPFYAIINPNSGPGAQPIDPSYQGCIPKLKAPNVNLIAYVATWFGDATKSSGVIADINTYASWDSSYVPDGIFFDQTSNNANDVALYTQYTTLAKQSFKGGAGVVSGNRSRIPAVLTIKP